MTPKPPSPPSRARTARVTAQKLISARAQSKGTQGMHDKDILCTANAVEMSCQQRPEWPPDNLLHLRTAQSCCTVPACTPNSATLPSAPMCAALQHNLQLPAPAPNTHTKQHMLEVHIVLSQVSVITANVPQIAALLRQPLTCKDGPCVLPLATPHLRWCPPCRLQGRTLHPPTRYTAPNTLHAIHCTPVGMHGSRAHGAHPLHVVTRRKAQPHNPSLQHNDKPGRAR